jgi:chromosome segregation ATPase
VISSLKANVTALTQKLDAINALEADAQAAIEAARATRGTWLLSKERLEERRKELNQQQLALTAEVKEAKQELAKQVDWMQQLARRLERLLEKLDDLRVAGPTRAPPALCPSDFAVMSVADSTQLNCKTDCC